MLEFSRGKQNLSLSLGYFNGSIWSRATTAALPASNRRARGSPHSYGGPLSTLPVGVSQSKNKISDLLWAPRVRGMETNSVITNPNADLWLNLQLKLNLIIRNWCGTETRIPWRRWRLRWGRLLPSKCHLFYLWCADITAFKYFSLLFKFLIYSHGICLSVKVYAIKLAADKWMCCE